MRGLVWFAGCVALLMLVLVGCESGNTPPPQPQEGQPITILRQYRGQQGPFPDCGVMAVQNPEVWEALWASRNVPDVDFSTETALVATMGRQPTAGYDIRITDVREKDGRVIVRVSMSRPAPDALVAQVVSYPFDIVIVGKISGPIDFVVDNAPVLPVSIVDGMVGQYSNAVAPQTAVIRDQLAWGRFWQERFGQTVAPPPVDFGQYMAVAVFIGQKPTGGYSVFIPAVSKVDERITVSYRVTSPNPGDVVTQAQTSPYAIAIIPASSLPVIFNALTTPLPK